MGAAGWELVSFSVQHEFFGRENNALATFKREKKYRIE
jgi:hypothetical protein